MPGFTQYSGIVLPSSIPANFAGKFGQLCELTNSVPFGIPGLGTDAPSPAPLAPLLAIDGSPRPETAPGLSAEQYQQALASQSGYARDWQYLQDLLDRPSPARLRDVRDPDPGHPREQVSVREQLAFLHERRLVDPSDPANRGQGDSIMQRACTVHRYQAAHLGFDAFEQHLNIIRARRLRAIKIEDLTAPPDDKTGSEFAEYIFMRGAINAGYEMAWLENRDAGAENDLLSSAALFTKLGHMYAPPMIHEIMRALKKRTEGEPSNKRLRNEADMWLKALKQSDSISFNVAYPRALHAAWAAGHPGNGLMEAVFKTGMEQMIPRKNTYAIHAITATLGAAWAQLMKADLTTATDLETPLSEQDYIQGDITDLNALPLSGEDWIEVYNRLQTAEDLLSGQAFEITLSLRQIISKINPSVADYRAAANWHTLFLPGKLPGQK
ncbi:MAG: hypothetical protein WC683_13890 [bacterium]